MSGDLPFPFRKGKNNDSARIYRMIWDSGARGCTGDEMEVALDLPHSSVSGRCGDLRNEGWIVDSGDRRPTRRGADATVWIVTSQKTRDPMHEQMA